MHSRAISTDIWRRTHRVDVKLTGNGGQKIQLQEGREARLPPSDLGSRCDGDQTCKRLPGKLALYLWLWQHSWNWSTYSSTSRRSTPNRCSWKKNGRTTPTGPTKMAGLTSGTWGTAHRYLWWGKTENASERRQASNSPAAAPCRTRRQPRPPEAPELQRRCRGHSRKKANSTSVYGCRVILATMTKSKQN